MQLHLSDITWGVDVERIVKHDYKQPYDPTLRMTNKYDHQGTIQQFIKPPINKYSTINHM